MVKTSTISWTDQTWNMIHAINLATGKRGWHCEHVTEACSNCYAETLNMRAGDSGGPDAIYPWMGHRRKAAIDKLRLLLANNPAVSGSERSRRTWITRKAKSKSKGAGQ